MLEVRGEIFMPNNRFAKMNEEREAKGLPRFLPIRAMQPLAPSNNSTQSEVAKRPLDFLAHGLGAYDGPELPTEDRISIRC